MKFQIVDEDGIASGPFYTGLELETVVWRRQVMAHVAIGMIAYSPDEPYPDVTRQEEEFLEAIRLAILAMTETVYSKSGKAGVMTEEDRGLMRPIRKMVIEAGKITIER